MELKPKTISSWAPGVRPKEMDGPRSILLFGPDQGGVFEYGRLAAGTGDRERHDAKASDPADMIGLLGSGSLFGGATTIVLDGAGDAQRGKIEQILAAPFADGARLIVLAGDLKASSKLRKLYQSGDGLLGVPLYPLRDREIQDYAQRYLASCGLTLGADARAALSSRMSGDRAIAQRSCEVVALHAAGRGSKAVEAADIRGTLDGIDEDGFNAPIDHALSGRPAEAVRALHLRLAAGESFVPMLRVFASRTMRIRDMLATGLSPREAVQKAKPPIFWTEKDAVQRMLAGLTIAKANKVLSLIDAAEYRIIEGGIRVDAAMTHLLLEISYHQNWKDAA